MAGPEGLRRDVALDAELARVEAMLSAAIAGRGSPGAVPEATEHVGLARLAACFALAPLERELVLVALAVEVSAALATAMDRLTGRSDGRPTVAALAAVLAAGDHGPSTITAALAPGEPLVKAGLIELIGDGALPTRAVRVPDRVWQRVVELPVPLAYAFVPRGVAVVAGQPLAATTRRAAEHVVARAAGALGRALIVVVGDADAAPESLAAAIAGDLGLPSLLVPAATLDDDAQRREAARDATWLGAAVIILGAPAAPALAQLAGLVPGPILVTSDLALPMAVHAGPRRWRVDVTIDDLPAEVRLAVWRLHLDGVPLAPDLDLARHVAHHRHGAARIAAMAARVRDRVITRGSPATPDDLRAVARHGAPRTVGLAQRLDGAHRLDDVVVPVATRRELDLACAWARHGAAALTGAAAGAPLHQRGGLVCLFYGLPGTGKTLAARAVAGELGVDLLRIDLSQVVNKYIGETEKNLERVFVEAEASGALLFFDEADALFGKRTEVKDAHDRYANIETAFLLQRLEQHRGVCILATNLRQNLDEAFSRRLQIIAEFPLPTADDRLRIWERHLIADHLAADVELPALARRFALAGGDISNAAATALVLAAADGVAVGMRHLIIGVWREIKKSGRLMSAEDFGPWRDVVLGLDRPAR